MNQIQERKHRLSRNLYVGQIIAVFTICLENKIPFFTTETIFNTFKEILLHTLNKFQCDAHIYLFMPDHGHFLLEGKTRDSDLYKCIINFKQQTGFWFYRYRRNKYGKDIRWQKDFYDHILRRDEDVLKQIRYILGNPERKKLVKYWQKYPFKGSTIYNLDKLDLSQTPTQTQA